jgi:hypothetical protein
MGEREKLVCHFREIEAGKIRSWGEVGGGTWGIFQRYFVGLFYFFYGSGGGVEGDDVLPGIQSPLVI